MKHGWVYILECSDKSYYTGSTSNIERRLAQHSAGVFPGYTSTRLPVTMMWSQEFADMNDAVAAERQIKGWSRGKKEALIRGDFELLHELAACKNQSRRDSKRRQAVTLRLRSG